MRIIPKVNSSNTTLQRKLTELMNPYYILHHNPRSITDAPIPNKIEDKEVKIEVSAADKLNPRNFSFKNENGAISYRENMLVGCCGVCVISTVIFGNIKEGMKDQFYKDVEEHLMYNEGNNDIDRGSLMMSDAVGGENGKQALKIPTIYEMCTFLEWDRSHKYFNPRSGNYITVFMKEKKCKNSIYCRYPSDGRPLVIKYKDGE